MLYIKLRSSIYQFDNYAKILKLYPLIKYSNEVRGFMVDID